MLLDRQLYVICYMLFVFHMLLGFGAYCLSSDPLHNSTQQ